MKKEIFTEKEYKMLEPGYVPILSSGLGYYLDNTPINVLNELKLQINSLKHDFNLGEKYNDRLAGEIEHEYGLQVKPNLRNYIKDLAYRLEENSGWMEQSWKNDLGNRGPHLPNTPTLNLSQLWVNFQKKYEYNPMHNHSGLFSFVLWYKIPYLLSDEQSQYGYKVDKETVNHGQFCFILNHPISGIIQHRIPIDKNSEGMIAIFPSKLHHCVYPFYSSDEYRISISGNVLLS